MALTVSNVGRGNYVLGGPGRRQGVSPAEALDAATRERQTQQAAEQQRRQTALSMQRTRQQMALAQAEEARRAQQFQLGLEDRQRAQARQAAAAARRQQQQAAMSELMAGLSTAGAPTGTSTAGGPSPIAPTAPPSAGVTLPAGPSVPLSFDESVSGMPADSFVGGAGDDVLQGGGGSPMVGYGVGQVDPRLAQATPAPTPTAGIPTLPDGSPDWAAFGQQLEAAGGVTTTRPGLAVPDTTQYGPVPLGVDRITEVDPTASAAMQDLQALSRRVDINSAATRIGNSVLERTSGFADYFLRTPEEGAQRAEARAQGERVRDWYTSDDAQAIFQENPALLQEAARDPLSFYQQYSGETLAPDAVLPEGVADPASPEAAAAETPTSPEEAAPVTQPTYGGLQLDFGTPVQLSFSETEGAASELYVAAPERIFQERTVVDRQRQRLELLANYYRQTNNLEGLVGVINQIDELGVEQRYLDGMTAIVGIQQQNFGPVQALLQQRYPNRQVEVRPYTDGTVEIFLDGQSEARLSWDDMATNLRSSYDRDFIAEQQAVAEQARERASALWEMETEQMLATAGNIAEARSQAEIDRLMEEGAVTEIGQTASGERVYQQIVNGQPVTVFFREVQVRGADGEPTTQFVAVPIDMNAVRPTR